MRLLELPVFTSALSFSVTCVTGLVHMYIHEYTLCAV